MGNTLLFGNGINRLSTNAISWSDLLDKIKGTSIFSSGELPNTMVYERIFMEKHTSEKREKIDELEIKEVIAKELQLQDSNEILKTLATLKIENYLTTNYDYAFEKALGLTPEKLSTEDIYSLRRKRKYDSIEGIKFLWNIHGEIGQPKSIMLGLDHYCGSVSKIDSYVKGTYKHKIDGEERYVEPMLKKLENSSFCFTSWVDLFFSTNVHIIGFSLDYTEIDIWWLLNKRARFSSNGLVNNKIYFYVNEISTEKAGLLKSFNVEVVALNLSNNDYKKMYNSAINKMNINFKDSIAA
ncbi:Uncharacterised protein [Lelliottia amnigena]|uniref:SIR2 family protein n=1 Tax=Lelliottia amnigena TaxID=61646 RepID=UPI00074370B8|nr:SIR2 family protein [Lelliottia amnigena]ATG02115.1 hypothetical protein CO697_11255 [Lelliottia amnigena]QXA22426.1 SIR2 family protein [Lelliottia amnigena]VDZ90229.1 Uncharacterised protein [Lelliottia amnigena]